MAPWLWSSPKRAAASMGATHSTLVTPDGDIVWEYVSPFFGPYDWFGLERGGFGNSVFRAYRYAADSPEIGGGSRDIGDHELAVLRAIRDTAFGTVEVTVHQSRIVQITRSEKLRL